MKVDGYIRFAATTLIRDLEDYLRRMAQAVNEAEVRVGPTTERPSGPELRTGQQYFDTTLGQPVWYDGAGWVDATGTAV